MRDDIRIVTGKSGNKFKVSCKGVKCMKNILNSSLKNSKDFGKGP